MATFNPDQPDGFSLITPEARMRWYETGAANTYRIGQGDPITVETAGYVDRASTGEMIVGIAMGFLNASGVPIIYNVAATAGRVLVCDDPAARYVIQANGYTTGTTSLAATNVGNCADTVDGDCVLLTGRSIYELDATDLASSPASAAQLKIVGVWDAPFNKFISGADGRYVRVIVTLNEHFYRSTTGI